MSLARISLLLGKFRRKRQVRRYLPRDTKFQLEGISLCDHSSVEIAVNYKVYFQNCRNIEKINMWSWIC